MRTSRSTRRAGPSATALAVAAVLAGAVLVGAVSLAGCGASANPPRSVARPVLSSAPPGASTGTVDSAGASTGTGRGQSAGGGAPITVLAPPTPTVASSAGTTNTSGTSTHTTDATGTDAPGTSEHSVISGTTTASTTSTHRDRTTARTEPAAPTLPDDPTVRGKVVVIDPGHNGGNASHPEIIHQQVPAGFGQHKNCNTTGTSTSGGYSEHRFNWKVAGALEKLLQGKGITVVMTRDSDDGVGPCVNKRAAIGNEAKADAVVSIHGDGEKSSIHGFFVMTASKNPASAAIARQTEQLALDIRDGLTRADFPISNAIGTHGLWARKDLAGLNLSKRPTVMLELGNMRNPAEAAVMTSGTGQQRYARGIAAGVMAFLGR